MVRFAPTPQDSPKPPSQTMMVALRAIKRTGLPLRPQRLPDGWHIVEGDGRMGHPRVLLSWFPRWVGDRLVADGYVDSDGQITDAGFFCLRGDYGL